MGVLPSCRRSSVAIAKDELSGRAAATALICINRANDRSSELSRSGRPFVPVSPPRAVPPAIDRRGVNISGELSATGAFVLRLLCVNVGSLAQTYGSSEGPREIAMYKQILIATDGSDLAQKAEATALRLAESAQRSGHGRHRDRALGRTFDGSAGRARHAKSRSRLRRKNGGGGKPHPLGRQRDCQEDWCLLHDPACQRQASSRGHH